MPALTETERTEPERTETVPETEMAASGGIAEAVVAETAETGIVSRDAVVPSDQQPALQQPALQQRAQRKSADPADIAGKQVVTELSRDLSAEQTDNEETALALATQAATHQRVRPQDVESEAESNPGSIAESNSRKDAIILVSNLSLIHI